MRMLKRHGRHHFFVWRGGWVLQLHMATALDKLTRFLRCFPLRRNDQSSREVEQLRQTKVETHYDSGKQT